MKGAGNRVLPANKKNDADTTTNGSYQRTNIGNETMEMFSTCLFLERTYVREWQHFALSRSNNVH